MGAQLSLLGHDAPAFDPAFTLAERTRLPGLARERSSPAEGGGGGGREASRGGPRPPVTGAWVDHVPGWVSGHASLFDRLRATVRFRTTEEELYGRMMTTPRLVASLPGDGDVDPIVEAMRAALSRRYAEDFVRISLALYRDGRDSVAWHGDRVAREMPEATVATVSLGDPRRFLLRPCGGGASIGFRLGWGDLLVMGGSCQRTYQHAVPKVARAGPRIALMFRPEW